MIVPQASPRVSDASGWILSVGAARSEVLPHGVEQGLVAGVLGFPLSNHRLQRLIPFRGLLLGRNRDETLGAFVNSYEPLSVPISMAEQKCD